MLWQDPEVGTTARWFDLNANGYAITAFQEKAAGKPLYMYLFCVNHFQTPLRQTWNGDDVMSTILIKTYLSKFWIDSVDFWKENGKA